MVDKNIRRTIKTCVEDGSLKRLSKGDEISRVHIDVDEFSQSVFADGM